MGKSNTMYCSRKYQAPEVKVVRFLVEQGFLPSSTTLTIESTPFNESANSGDKFFGGNDNYGVTTGSYTEQEWGWDLSN